MARSAAPEAERIEPGSVSLATSKMVPTVVPSFFRKVPTMVPYTSHSGACPLDADLHGSIIETGRRKWQSVLALRDVMPSSITTSHSGGHGARTRNPLRGTTFPVCWMNDGRLW